MHSFLIEALGKNEASSYTLKLLKEKGVDPLDIDRRIYEKTMGIEDVRNIQKQILLKPFRGKIKAVIIEAYENITPEAQNALLKILEEPPANTIIIIYTSKKELLLPTIISRCKIIILRENNLILSNGENAEYLNILMSLSERGIPYKLKLAQDVVREEKVLLWMEKMAFFVKNKLTQDNNNLKYLNFLKELQKTYKVIKSTNVSQRAALENLFLSF